MTALMSLESRLALAKLALHVRAEQADLRRLAQFLLPSVDLLVIGSCGEVERDAEVIGEFRQAYAHVPLLLATDNGDAAESASADVVYLDHPHWKLFGDRPRGHEWTLLGRGARDVRAVTRPGDDFSFLFVPVDRDTSDEKVLRAALDQQRPLQRDALPWFAYGDYGVQEARGLVGVGVRRIALTGDALDGDGDAASLVVGVKEVLEQAWHEDEASKDYRFWAASL